MKLNRLELLIVICFAIVFLMQILIFRNVVNYRHIILRTLSNHAQLMVKLHPELTMMQTPVK